MKTCPFCANSLAEREAQQCPNCRADLRGSGDDGDTPPFHRLPFSPRRVIAWRVITGVAMLLCAWMLQAVHQAREAARRSQCSSQLCGIALALHNYHDVYGTFPPAHIADEKGRPIHSWRVLILPWIDQQSLYDAYDFSRPWDSPANRFVLDNMPRQFACPSNPQEPSIYTSYAAVTGPGTVFDGANAVSLAEITDGSRSTLIIGEVRDAAIPWTSPQDVDVTAAPRIGDPGRFSSHHDGGGWFLFADGSRRFLSWDTPQHLLQALYTRNGGEDIGDF